MLSYLCQVLHQLCLCSSSHLFLIIILKVIIFLNTQLLKLEFRELKQLIKCSAARMPQNHKLNPSFLDSVPIMPCCKKYSQRFLREQFKLKLCSRQVPDKKCNVLWQKLQQNLSLLCYNAQISSVYSFSFPYPQIAPPVPSFEMGSCLL